MNCVVLQACYNGSYLRNRLRNVLLILENLYLVEPIFKTGFLHLSYTEPTFRYGEILKFWGLIGYIYNMLEMTFFWKIIGASPRIKLLKNLPKEKWNLLLVLFIVYQTADIGLTEKVRGDECRFEISVQRKNESYIMQVRNLRWWNMNTLVVCFLSILLCFLCHTDKKFEVANNWTIFTWNVSVTFLTL